jgi:lipopolysaccharide export system protein LptC
MKARTYDRMAAGFAILILAILAGFSYYLAQFAGRGDITIGPKVLKHEPDYFVERFALVKLNEAGKPTFRLSAESVLHYPDDDTSEFVKPLIVSIDDTKPVVQITSDKGKAGPKGEITELFGNVEITRAADRKGAKLIVKTDYITINTSDEVAATDKLVSITQGNSELTGIGMDFDNLARTFALRSEVKGVVTPDKNKKN